MSKYLTVGELRRMLEHVPDDVIVVGNEFDHTYRPFWSIGGYTTVLRDEDDQYTEDIFVGEELGEETEYGVRTKAFIIE
jgi:hypothetical protein